MGKPSYIGLEGLKINKVVFSKPFNLLFYKNLKQIYLIKIVPQRQRNLIWPKKVLLEAKVNPNDRKV